MSRFTKSPPTPTPRRYFPRCPSQTPNRNGNDTGFCCKATSPTRLTRHQAAGSAHVAGKPKTSAPNKNPLCSIPASATPWPAISQRSPTPNRPAVRRYFEPAQRLQDQLAATRQTPAWLGNTRQRCSRELLRLLNEPRPAPITRQAGSSLPCASDSANLVPQSTLRTPARANRR